MASSKCVIGSEFCAAAPTKLVFTCTAASGSYSAMDSQGTIVFRVEPRAGFHDKRVLIHGGDTLVCFKTKAMSLHNTWRIYRGFEPNDSNILMTVRDSSVIQLITGMDVLVAPNQDVHRPDFTIKGKYMAREYTVASASGEFLACGKRRRDAGHYLANSNTYDIDIAAGADMALVIALFVIVDDNHSNKNVQAV